MMEAAVSDIVFENGKFAIAGTDRSVGIDEVARQSFHSARLPSDVETGFTERANFGPADPATFPSGAHLCEVEIDEETGEVALDPLCAVDDVGRVLNPLLCEGQIHGGIVQGVGQALMEDLVYDQVTGQLVTGSFQDYCMPRADNFCAFDLASNPTLTDKNPWRQGRRRSRHDWRDPGGDERRQRRAGADRRSLCRGPGDLGKTVACHPHGANRQARPALSSPNVPRQSMASSGLAPSAGRAVRVRRGRLPPHPGPARVARAAAHRLWSRRGAPRWCRCRGWVRRRVPRGAAAARRRRSPGSP